MSTCNWLDLQALGSQLIMPKNLPDHWANTCTVIKKPTLINTSTSVSPTVK
jgi:hypothetical protein